MLWTIGNKKLQIAFRSLSIDVFLESYNQIYSLGNNIKGTALFLTKNLEKVPPYAVHCMLRTNIMYEENIFISISTSDYPYGINVTKVEEIAPGLKGLIISCGYMEYLNIPSILKNAGINEKVIFYGIEEITTKRPFLRLYAFLKENHAALCCILQTELSKTSWSCNSNRILENIFIFTLIKTIRICGTFFS